MALYFVLRAVYKVLAAWWLEPWMDRRVREQFLNQIRAALPFLFHIYGGTPVSSSRPLADETSETVAYIQAYGLLFRFAQWRDELLEIRVANSARPNDMFDLNDLLALLGATERIPSGGNAWICLLRCRWLLEPRFEMLAEALADENIAKTTEQLRATSKARW